ncbi:MAG: hypothetical protein WCW77_01755 [Patescibacteria group bacterium]|jgi:streptogramin lyase
MFQHKKAGKYLVLIFCLASAVFALSWTLGQPTLADSSDAIALRTVPNPEHYSPLRWYLTNIKSQGSPQSLEVDGYEAIRDGRTVYVNAANLSENVLYTNIYIISYNQDAEPSTTDILGKILKSWKFNINLKDEVGLCKKNSSQVCLTNDECPSGDICQSLKARVIRDTRRLSDVVELKIYLNKYKNKNGNYPTLTAGTYLPNKTISVWPSWKDNFAKELGITPVPTDPENKLGPCVDNYHDIDPNHVNNDARFEAGTCWDEKTKQFADSDVTNSILDLPVDSHVYVYSGTANGISYTLCGVMESGYVTSISQGACVGSAPAGTPIGWNEELDNHEPYINATLPDSHPDSAYQGTIFATDQDKDKLSWVSFEKIGDWSSWTNAPSALTRTSDPNKKQFSNPENLSHAGLVGEYQFKVTVNDGRGKDNSISSKTFTITVANNKPVIKTPLVCAETAYINDSYAECVIKAFDKDKDNLTFHITGDLPEGMSYAVQNGENNSKEVKISGTPTEIGASTISFQAEDDHEEVSDVVSLSINVTLKECFSKVIDLDATGATNDAMVYDTNSNAGSAVDTDGGTYLKLGKVMPTPYIWIANDMADQVTKMRTYPGYKRNCKRKDGKVECYWDKSVPQEDRGIIGTYNVGDYPSRTAINAETGDMWIANRGDLTTNTGSSIMKLDINGKIKKTCHTGIHLARGVAIELNGDVWVANYNDGNIVKIPGDDTACPTLFTEGENKVTVGGNPYGLAIDSDNNIWVSNPGLGKIQKVNTKTKVLDASSSDVPTTYGITVDSGNNVWTGNSYNHSLCYWKNGQEEAECVDYASSEDPNGNKADFSLDINKIYTTGVSVDVNDENIWASSWTDNVFIKADKNGKLLHAWPSEGKDARGICGDSYGQMWVANYDSIPGDGSIIKVVNLNGGDVEGTAGPWNLGKTSYTYSDMTGLNRAMLLRSGYWTSQKMDKGTGYVRWGTLYWQEKIEYPEKESLAIKVASFNAGETISWLTADEWNSQPEKRKSRYSQIKIEMKSQVTGNTPVLWDLKFQCD